MGRILAELDLWLMDRTSAYDWRYNEDQPRDDHGRFGEGGGSDFADKLSGAESGQAAIDAAPAGLGRESTGLTDAQRGAAEEYISFFGYRDTNGQLRAGGELKPSTSERVRNLDEAMSSSPLSADVVVYRGMRDGEVVFGDQFGGNLTGAEWTESAFLSTSASEGFADSWSRHGLGRDSDPLNPVVMRIVAPSGTGALDLGRSELLLDRGLGLRVAEDRGVIDGARHLDVEVVQ